MRILRAAIRAVPAVKYALGVAGIIAACAVVKGFYESTQAALTSGAAMIGLMVLLLVFAAATTLKPAVIRLPALFLTWGILILFMSSSFLTASAAFFDWPKRFPELVQDFSVTAANVDDADVKQQTTPEIAPRQISTQYLEADRRLPHLNSIQPAAKLVLQSNELRLSGTIVDRSTNKPLPGVALLVNGTFTTTSDDSGSFFATISGVSVGSRVRLIATLAGYQSRDITVPVPAKNIMVGLLSSEPAE